MSKTNWANERKTDMIETAGWGVCMANGCDDAKAVADAITEHGVLDDGFGRHFEDHLLYQDRRCQRGRGK